jgi:hypothetical protein
VPEYRPNRHASTGETSTALGSSTLPSKDLSRIGGQA